MEKIIFDVDSYKVSHAPQYPPETTSMFSYVESRGGLYPNVVFFGLHYILRTALGTPVTHDDVSEATKFYAAHGEPFNEEGWRHIVNAHGGFMPVRIRALAEGSVVPVHTPLVTVESLDPKVFWAASWIETALMRLWYPTNVATIGYHIRKTLKAFLELSSDDPTAEIDFKLHDFGSRGVSSRESAEIGGMAHLVNFNGSDTVVGVRAAGKYYDAGVCGFSIPAAEHSSITSWGQEHEADAYRNMLDKFAKPGSLVAVVSDSYDIYAACEHIWGGELRERVISSGATVVIRPDSGEPREVVLKCVEILAKKFGYTTNSKGFKVLNNVRVIQGDGVNHESIRGILDRLAINGWSASNVAFGMGGALLQGHNRDTQRFAMKCSSVTVNGEERDVFKSPVGDPTKYSMRGRLDVESFEGKVRTAVLRDGAEKVPYSIMREVYNAGNLSAADSFDIIRARARKGQ